MMGIPSVVIAVLVVLAALLAYSNDADLRARYDGLAKGARDKASDLRRDLQNENLDSLPKDDARKVALAEEIVKEQMFLRKLITLDKDNPEPKFQLAQLAFQQRNRQLGESLLEVIAPFEEPGYAKAHIALAEIYMVRAARSRSDQQRAIDLKRADKQISNAIIADETNMHAKKIKAQLLQMSRNFLQAYKIYEELFETEPIYYRELLKLARVLKEGQKEKKVLDQAASEYRQLTQKKLDNVSDWVAAWDNYIYCLKRLKQFGQAETALVSELNKHRGDPGKELFLKKQLSRVLSERVLNMGRSKDPAIQQKQLE